MHIHGVHIAPGARFSSSCTDATATPPRTAVYVTARGQRSTIAVPSPVPVFSRRRVRNIFGRQMVTPAEARNFDERRWHANALAMQGECATVARGMSQACARVAYKMPLMRAQCALFGIHLSIRGPEGAMVAAVGMRI